MFKALIKISVPCLLLCLLSCNKDFRLDRHYNDIIGNWRWDYTRCEGVDSIPTQLYDIKIMNKAVSFSCDGEIFDTWTIVNANNEVYYNTQMSYFVEFDNGESWSMRKFDDEDKLYLFSWYHDTAPDTTYMYDLITYFDRLGP